jgi:mRNA interferase MazF
VKRGELYRVRLAPRDPRRSRVFLIASRALFLAANYSTLACVPVYTTHNGLITEVLIGVDEGLKRSSSLHCDEVTSLPPHAFSDYVGALSAEKQAEVDRALVLALGLDVDNLL